jgi:hypothetical protein
MMPGLEPAAFATGSAEHRPLPVLAALFIGLASILLLLPILSGMPRAGLDTSFTLPLNEAVARGMLFGRDVIYPVGPLGAIWFQAYHPATILMTAICGGVLAIGHAYLAFTIARHSHRSWAWVYIVFLIFVLESRDALFSVYPALLALLVYRVSLPRSHPDGIGLSRAELVWLAIAISSLGLLPIIRQSFLPLPLVVCVIGSILLWRSGHKWMAVLLVILPPASMVLFWTLAGQDSLGLADYFVNSMPLVSGYAQAMGIGSDFLDCVLFAASSLLVLLCAYPSLSGRSLHEYGFLLLLAAFLFMSFKAGFVRHDVHALTAGSNLVMAAIVLGALRTVGRRRLWVILPISLIVWTSIHLEHKGSKFEYYRSLGSQLRARLKEWSADQVWNLSLEARYKSSLVEIRRKFPLPLLQGTTDIYQFETAPLIASGSTWSPRPIMHGYVAYTGGLEVINARHLSGPKAPDNVLFNVETIDNRYPSEDDGPSWPVLLARYELAGETTGYLLLRKRAEPWRTPVMEPLFSRRVQLGEGVDADFRGDLVYARIKVAPSLIGGIVNFMYKPTPLKIAVELSDGTKREHRLVPDQASAGFILSPYVGDKAHFSKMLQGPTMRSSLPSIVRFTIEEVPRDAGLWSKEYAVTLSRVVLDVVAPGGPAR